MLAEFGGSAGIRDEGLLESALADLQNLFAYGEPAISELAASYAFRIVRNHPFIDGNKRTGFMVAYIFLERNGQTFIATEANAAAVIITLAGGEMGEKELARWFAKNSTAAT